MIKLIYIIDKDSAAEEKKWLNDMKIYPAMTPHYENGTVKTLVGVIVTSEDALLIKLRHPTKLQGDYHQR